MNRSSRGLAAAALAAAVALAPVAPLGAQFGPPPSAGPQWLNADTSKKVNQSNFRELREWPTPNEWRTASGTPGPKYWQ